MLKNALIFIMASFIMACSSKKQKVDLMILDANIYTVDSAFGWASAMVITDGKIVETGSDEHLLAAYEPEEKIFLDGKTILPGFIDAHCHFTGYATDMWKCDLVGTNSYGEVLDKLKAYAANAPMYWLYARGWDQNDWKDISYPDNSELNKMFPNRPVLLKRIDGHAGIANKKALQLAGIDANTKIAGGKIELINGEPSGLLIDNALDLVDKVVPAISDSLAKVYIQKCEKLCFSYGLTGVHDCGISEHTVDILKNMNLQMKVYAMLSDKDAYYDTWLKSGPLKLNNLHVGGFKVYADGALGSRGACLLHPYADENNWHGFLLAQKTHFENIAEKLIHSNFQMCTHAIGDSANRVILNAYAKVLQGKNNKRWRIEHAQVVDTSDFHLFGDYNIIPSVQPTHATSDMYWASQRLGEAHMKGAYAYKKLLAQNNNIALGTDFPVEDISAIKTFYAAVMRKDKNGNPLNGFQISDALSRQETLRGMTIWAAYAAFEEKEKGSLEKGKAADFIVLSNDLMTCKDSMILNTKILATYINGKMVYKQ